MKPTVIRYTRLQTFSAYCNETYYAEAEVGENEDPGECLRQLSYKIEREVEQAAIERGAHDKDWQINQRNEKARIDAEHKRKWLEDNPGKTEDDYQQYLEDPFYDYDEAVAQIVREVSNRGLRSHLLQQQ